MDKFWKKAERYFATRYGATRIGISQGDNQPDFRNAWLSAEVVCHGIPQWVRNELGQALRDAAGTARLPVLMIHQKGDTHDGDLVVMREQDFFDWYGAPAEAGDAVTITVDTVRRDTK